MATIKGITVEINGDTTELNKALREANKTIKDTGKDLKELDRLLKIDPGNTELLTQKQEKLAQAIEQTKDKLEKEKLALEQLRNGPQNETTIAQQENLTREIEKTTQSLARLEDEYKNFASVAGAKLQVVGDKIQDFGQGITNAGKAISPLSVAVTGLGTVAAAKFASVDKIMSLTNATMKNTKEQAEMLNKAMENAAANSIFSMNDAANATLNFARAGLDATQAANALAPAMNLAAGEGGDLNIVSAGLVATINGFHDSFESTAHYADVFAAACNNSMLDINSLSQAMSIATPIFNTIGKSVEDTALFLGVLANNGIEANTAATALKTGLARLAAPAKKGCEALNQLGIELFNSDGAMKDSITVHEILHDSFSKLSEQEQMAAASAIFGKNHMAAWLALINSSHEDFLKLNQSIKECTGTTDEMSNAMMSGFGGSIERVKSSIDVLMTTLGRTLAEAIQPVIDKIQSFVDWLNSLDESTRKTIVTIGLITAALAPVLIIVGQVVSAVGSITITIGKLTTFLNSGTVLASISAFVAAWTPVVAILAGVVAAIWAVYEVIENWDAIADICVETWNNAIEGISLAFSYIKDSISNALSGVGDYLLDTFSGWGDKIKSAASYLTKPFSYVFSLFSATAAEGFEGITVDTDKSFTDINKITREKWDSACSYVTKKITEIKSNASEKWANIKDNISSVCGNIGNYLDTKWENIKTKLDEKLTGINNNASNKWNNLKEDLANISDNISNALNDKFNNIKDGLTVIFENIKGVAGEKWAEMKNSIANISAGIWDDVKNTFGWIYDKITGVVDKIKNIFDFEWELPSLKLPHLKIEGEFSLMPPSVPDFSIEWYKKAMNDAYILNSPTIFGMGGGHFMGGGEAGPEAIVGTKKLEDIVKNAMNANNGNNSDIIIPVYIGSERIEEIVVKANKSMNYRSGGR